MLFVRRLTAGPAVRRTSQRAAGCSLRRVLMPAQADLRFTGAVQALTALLRATVCGRAVQCWASCIMAGPGHSDAAGCYPAARPLPLIHLLLSGELHDKGSKALRGSSRNYRKK